MSQSTCSDCMTPARPWGKRVPHASYTQSAIDTTASSSGACSFPAIFALSDVAQVIEAAGWVGEEVANPYTIESQELARRFNPGEGPRAAGHRLVRQNCCENSVFP